MHADYHARNSNGQPPRNNWRSNQNSSPNAPGSSRTYGTRQNTSRDQDFERRSNNGYSNSRPSGPSRPDGDRPRYNGQRSNGNGPSSYRSDGPRSNGYQRGNSNDSGSYDRSSGPRSGNQYRSGERRYDDNRYNSTPYRPGSRPAQVPRINKPEGERPRRGAGREVHPEKEYRPRINELKPPKEARPPHPRFLSRPEVRRERDAKRYEEHAEQFEGDYEQFDSDNERRPTERSERPARNNFRPRNDRRSGSDQRPERHVTPLPDGRVLKGSRPVQRKNAEFWTNINNDTDALIEQVQVNGAQGAEVPTEQDIQSDGEQPQSVKRAPRTTKSKGSTETTKKPRSSGPKPSQKGYKWPTS
ncbi:MAG: hypothetical protein H0U76_25620 [Ktedonobacteraceae bacterium]|nr:hypothetical protein [Ktedonobacteraceae bacterium]